MTLTCELCILNTVIWRLSGVCGLCGASPVGPPQAFCPCGGSRTPLGSWILTGIQQKARKETQTNAAYKSTRRSQKRGNITITQHKRKRTHRSNSTEAKVATTRANDHERDGPHTWCSLYLHRHPANTNYWLRIRSSVSFRPMNRVPQLGSDILPSLVIKNIVPTVY